ncbi:rho family-interacting cell polarization regulator 1-like isoform X2 [Myripristis murdjan]|uniref:rho family-interacting cell polarization regulator 1-like isoform X2 n=1 Tax=Myripristis murdjan TaxID=586833 RepID=UPI001175F06A|nr:rho family-interacting cell polarization regulator 1-like isoform X2 [Myripristis murdjan]
MFTGSTKLPPTKTPQPERLDEVYAALRRGLQSYLQVHQLELDSLGQQIRENKRNGRLGSLYELDKQVKAIERFMRRLEFHLSKVEELYDAYCIQRRLRDGASKMVAAFNSTTGSREARESLSEANKGYRECTEHMCSLESELESQMGEFHIKMKGLAGFARLCAGDQYEVLMRYGRQRWRLRGRVEVSSKQIWDSEEYIFLPLITELLSIKVTELKSLANHVVVGSVSCEMLDLFCPLPQTLAVDINDLGTVKLNLEVTWSPFDKDDQTSTTSTVSKRLLSNQSPPDTPSMREQVFYSLLKRQGELENGTVWSNSSESSDDSSSPALAHHTQRLTASNTLQTTPTAQLSFTPHQPSTSTPSLSSNQEEDEPDAAEAFGPIDSGKFPVPNGHLQSASSDSHIGDVSQDCTVTDAASARSADLSETSDNLSCSDLDVSSQRPVMLAGRPQGLDLPDSGEPEVCVSAQEGNDDRPKESALKAEPCEAAPEDSTTETGADGEAARDQGCPEEHSHPHHSTPVKHPEDSQIAYLPSSSSFSLEVETALESFDFLNCSDLEDEEDESEDEEEEEEQKEEEVEEKDGEEEKDQCQMEEEHTEEEEQDKNIYTGESDEEEVEGLEILMEAPEGFRNSDEDCYSHSESSSVENLQDLGQMEMPEEVEDVDGEEEEVDEEEQSEAKGDERHEQETSAEQEERPSTPSHLATTAL